MNSQLSLPQRGVQKSPGILFFSFLALSRKNPFYEDIWFNLECVSELILILTRRKD